MAVKKTTETATVLTDVSPSHELWKLVFELAEGVGRHFASRIAEFELSGPQAHTLLLLAQSESLSMSDLAEDFACHASNITGIIDRLEARGLVERHGSGHDRRVKHLALTPAGRDLHDRLLRRLHEPPTPTSSLSERDQTALRDILRRVMGGQDARPSDPKAP